MTSMPDRHASYVVGPERTYYVTTIDYRNPCAPSFDCHESGIRDLSRHHDGRHYASSKEHAAVVSFVLCQHNIYPLKAGHEAVVAALKLGVEPEGVYEHLYRDREEP